jgi:hypothetical protein
MHWPDGQTGDVMNKRCRIFQLAIEKMCLVCNF